MTIAATEAHFAFLSALAADKQTRHLTYPDFRIIDFLAAEGTVDSIGTIAKATDMNLSLLGRRLDHLAKHHLISRKTNREDRRRFTISLTAYGWKAHAQVAELYRQPSAAAVAKRRGRPAGAKNKPVVDEQAAEQPSDTLL